MNKNYRPGVGVMLINANDQIFVARRNDMQSQAWQMPQGGIDKNENPDKAALRELQEETGIHPNQVALIAQYPGWLFYDLPHDLQKKMWHGKYNGQKQKWFLYRFTGDDTAINIFTENPEFFDWKWAKMHDIPNLIVPFKRDLYQKLVNEFSRFII